MDFQIAPIWPWPFVLVVGGALLAFSHWTYGPGTPRRRLLLAFRWVAIALALFAVLRPKLVFTKKHLQSSVLVVLADKSKSMLLKDMWNDQSRWDALKTELADADPDFKDLQKDVQIRFFQFDQKLAETIVTTEPPKGEQTAIGDALKEVVENRLAGERLAGIIVLSDGANTAGVSPQSVARDLARSKIPIFAFGFGQETAKEQIKDISAQNIVASPTVYKKNKMTVRADFISSGFSNQRIGTRLLLNGAEKARGTLNLGRDAQRADIDLTAVPDQDGDVKVTVEAEVQPGELLPGNNAVSTYVTVLAGGISVLHIEGKYRYWEPKFIRWALDKSPDIELNQFFILDTAGNKNEWPEDLFKPGRFDVIILGDVNSNQFSAEQLQALRALIDRGTGVIMIGGYESFGPGNWGDTPLAERLPVVMRPGDAQTTAPLQMVPTDTGLRHFILRLASSPQLNKTAWESLRPLDGGSTWSGLKAGALLLAATPDGATPLLVAQEVGAGRTIAFAGDTTWRWRKSAEGIQAHVRFWRQLILWLAKKDEAGDAQVRVELEKRRLAISQQLPVTVRVDNPDGTPIQNPTLQAVVVLPDGKEAPLQLLQQGEVFRGTFSQTDLPGDYAVRVTAAEGAKALGSKTVKFLTYAEDSEMRQLAADHGLLRQLAELTDGEFHTPEELPKFVKSLKTRDLNLEVSQPIDETLWDRWELLLLFVLVLTVEWVVRKRLGLA